MSITLGGLQTRIMCKISRAAIDIHVKINRELIKGVGRLLIEVCDDFRRTSVIQR